ncbi:MAG: dihydropteroate synthase [Lachnospiraceae bacterium]
MGYRQLLLERGLEHGMEAEDIWFDPLFLVVKGMQDKQMQVLECIKMFSDMGLNSTGGLSNNSNGMPKAIRPIMDSALVAMAMMQGTDLCNRKPERSASDERPSSPVTYSRATPCMQILI